VSGPWRLSFEDLRARGDAPALRSIDEQLSYRQLADRAAVIAEALAAAGVAPGDAVGLLFGRRGHVEPVALAAVLGARAVAVPLDTQSPAARLAALVQRAGCRALLYDRAAAELAAELRGALAAIELDAGGRPQLRSRGCSGEAPQRPGAAAILHTSGTTGVPKAVPIEWEGLDAFTAWMIELTGLATGDRVLRISELGFDLAWFDHVATWRAGALLVTVERREIVGARTLADRVGVLRPQVIYAVPSFLVKLLGGWPADAPLHQELRVICFAGEVFPPPDLLALARRAPHCRLVNLFGPTETNVCTYYEVDPVALDGRSELPIGVAPPYAECSLVAEDGAVVAGPGIGELVVAGPTALGGRCATGDRVERGVDGLFYFRGRLDRMVKIRGYRVQPAEVEAALLADPRVREAAIVVTRSRRVGLELEGHVTLRDEGAVVDSRELRRAVAALLPPHMLPQRIAIRAELPRTTTGKIDYGKLAPRSDDGAARSDRL
jgi:acyl-CoA synthetase (AMP-forming)/AMP-acid ligase II